MNKDSMANQNKFIKDPKERNKQIQKNVWSSSAIEGIYPPAQKQSSSKKSS